MPAHFRAVTPVLIVADVAPTRAFFIDRLGFRSPAEEGAGNVLDVVTRGQVAIRIVPERMPASSVQEDWLGPYRAMIYIEVDSVELIVPEVIDTDVVLPLRKNTRTSMHEIGIREPGGNIIVFASPLGD